MFSQKKIIKEKLVFDCFSMKGRPLGISVISFDREEAADRRELFSRISLNILSSMRHKKIKYMFLHKKVINQYLVFDCFSMKGRPLGISVISFDREEAADRREFFS